MSWMDTPMDALALWISQLLHGLAGLSVSRTVGLWVGMVATAYGLAHGLQLSLRRQLRRQPGKPAELGWTEITFSLLAPLGAIRIFIEGAKALQGRISQWRRKSASDDSTKKGAGKDSTKPLVVATLGPTFLLSGLLCTVVFWVGTLLAPLLRQSLGLSSGLSPWQYWLLGQRVEFAWLLPLEDQPYLGVTLYLAFWLAAWWSLGNLLRGIVFRSRLARNLITDRESALPLWYRRFGVIDLVRPAASYRLWVGWYLTAGFLLLLLAGTTLTQQRGAAPPAAWAVAVVLCLSWLIHLHLRGLEQQPTRPEEEVDEPEAKVPPGWPAVEGELDSRYGFHDPEVRFERSLACLSPTVKLKEVPTLSPLLGELLEKPNLTLMQKKVLQSLALQGFVHLEPPPMSGELTLGRDAPTEVEDLSDLSQRHQIVLAPEGSGKSTLALLAAANHALLHARATLVVTRSEDQAEECYESFRAAVSPSTMRWNLRVRRLGRDFAHDLSRDIIPDVVVCSLRQLVTRLLDNAEIFLPFLRNVGLVIVEDAESFAGAVEIHAQLAFRRLHRLFRQIMETERLAEENTPLVLILAVDSMRETATWAKALCGVQAAVRSFPELQSLEETGHWQCFYFHDLRTASGRQLTLREVIEACEAGQVPWHYRPCGDGRRHWGKGPVRLNREAECFRPDPAEATVLFLEGRWSEVRREALRLPAMGCGTGTSPITVVAILDPLEEVWETLLPGLGLSMPSRQEELGGLAGELATLPLPIVRPPSSAVTQTHLLADLVQHWVEVGDLVDTFEGSIAHSLRRLQRQGMLYTEERNDIRPEIKDYESKVYVRAPGSLLETAEDSHQEGVLEFSAYDKVRQVELISRRAVVVRNRADQSRLRTVEADSAPIVFYPGRVFEDSRGRFVVVGQGEGSAKGKGAIEVEPALHEDVTSPRLQLHLLPDAVESAASPHSAILPMYPAKPVLLGRDPVEVGLLSVAVTPLMMATYRLSPLTGKVHSRQLHRLEAGPAVTRKSPLRTNALVLHPNPKGLAEGSPLLRLREARLLATVLRYLLPLLYRDIHDHVIVALSVQEPTGDWHRPLAPEDSLCIVDLHREGNGSAWALYRDGLELPLRLCRYFLEEMTDVERLQHFYDHWGDLDEIQQEGYREEKEEREEEPPSWSESQRELLSWLESRLYPETAFQDSPSNEEPVEPMDDASQEEEEDAP